MTSWGEEHDRADDRVREIAVHSVLDWLAVCFWCAVIGAACWVIYALWTVSPLIPLAVFVIGGIGMALAFPAMKDKHATCKEVEDE